MKNYKINMKNYETNFNKFKNIFNLIIYKKFGHNNFNKNIWLEERKSNLKSIRI